MKTKKILAAIAALTIVCGAIPTQPFADVIGNMAITASAETSEDVFEFEDGVILRYCGYATKVVIPSTIGGDTVTSIGSSAFSFSSVKSITIPDSVTSIGWSAFSCCSSLGEINIPDSVTSIGEVAFYGCSSLTEITIPDSVTSIGDNAFLGCSSLREINIPDSVASIGMSAFSGCETLTSITAPCKVKWNESDWKAGCNANVTYTHLSEGVEICDNCRYITGNCGVHVYEDTYADNATYSFDAVTGTLTIGGEGVLGDNVDSTWHGSWCNGIKSVIIDDKITAIGAGVFACFESLTSITISDGVMTLGDDWGDVFNYCTNLKNITAPCRLKGNVSIDKVVEANGATVTWNHVFAEDSDACECGDVERYITGSCGAYHEETDTYDDVSYKFDKATGLLTISGTGAVKESAFDAEWADDKEKEFASDIKTVVSGNGITKIENFAFYGCLSLTTVEMNSVTLIEYGAFCNCSSLETVEMNSVTSIGVYAFQKCTSLASVEMNSVTSIGEYAFQWCESLETVEMNSVTSIGVDAFDACDSLTSVTLGSTVPTGLNKIPASVTLIIPAEAYDSYKYFEYFGYKLYDAETGNLLTEIEEDVIAGICGDNAFYVFNKATGTLTISGEGAIDGSAFAPDVNTWVEEIEKVVIGDGITTIGEEAFLYCNALTSVEMNSVTSVGDYAFQNCKSLSTIKMNSVTSIGIEAFSGCSSLTTVEMNSVTSIGESAFGACTSLSTIKMNSVETIGANAFCNCFLLTTVEMNSVTSIGMDAFSHCESLANITAPCRLKGDINIDIVVASNGATVTYNHIFDEDAETCVCGDAITGSCGAYNEETDTYDDVTYIFDKATGKLTISGEGAIGEYAFGYREDIKSVVIGNDITSIEYNAFSGCSSLTSVEMNNVETIGSFAFDGCTALTSVEMNSVTSIGNEAFQNCTSLATVGMNSVISIGRGVFVGCSSLKEVTAPCAVKNSESDWNYSNTTVTYTHLSENVEVCDRCKYVQGECGDNATYVFDRATGKLTISGTGAVNDYAFVHWNIDWYDEIKTVVIENGITEIDSWAFSGCSSLETVEMNSVTSIGDFAFKSCTSLKSVKMNSVTSICLSAFQNCTSLTSVEMNSVTSIGYGAFIACDSLTSVTLGSEVPGGLAEIPASAKLIIPAEAYENYKDLGYNLGFSDIKGIGYILEGQIGIRLATDLSADKLAVMCGDKTIDLTQKTGYVEFYLSAQDMAKEYTVYYADGEIEIAKFNPKSNLSGYEDTKYAEVAKALITYCETANAYFNGGEIADMSSEYDAVINAITPNTVDMGEDYDSSSLILESSTIVRHYYTKNDGTMTAKGNYFYKEESVDPTMFARTDTYSVNDYIYKVLNSDKADANLKNLCVTLYKYGVAAETLKNGGNK